MYHLESSPYSANNEHKIRNNRVLQQADGSTKAFFFLDEIKSFKRIRGGVLVLQQTCVKVSDLYLRPCLNFSEVIFNLFIFFVCFTDARPFALKT